jgi:hypothetical protein
VTRARQKDGRRAKQLQARVATEAKDHELGAMEALPKGGLISGARVQ